MKKEDFKKAREKLGLTPRQLSHKWGLSYDLILKIEQGNKEARPIYKYAFKGLENEKS